MSLVPGIPNPYLDALIGGLFYGSVVCTASCLPYVASYIAGIGAGFRKGVLVTLTFSSGRIAAYALIGAAVGILSGVLRFFVSETTLLPFQQYSSIAFGIVTIIIGVGILLKARSSSSNCAMAKGANVSGKKLSERFDFRALSLGLSRGLVICPPLLVLLVASLPFAAPIDSLILAVLFGVGTALSPMLFLGGATGWLLNKAPLFRKWISVFGAGLLIALGAGALLTSVTAT
jgi:thiol:disulfide interchange protein DsbD